MGKSCCAIDCTNRFNKESQLSFYRLPKAKEKRSKWIAAIRRNNWNPSTETWICGSHFVSGKKSDDPLHPDYVPSLFSFTSTADRAQAVNHLERYLRVCSIFRSVSATETPDRTLLATVRGKEIHKKSIYNLKYVHRYQRRENQSNDHCCVPLCSNSSRYNSVLSFHCFPKDPQHRLQWKSLIRRNDLIITSHTKVCSKHFSSDEISTTNTGRRTLKVGAFPSLFKWNNFTKPQTRSRVWESRRASSPPTEAEEQANTSQRTLEAVPVLLLEHDYCVPGAALFLQRFAGSPEDIQFYTRFPSRDHLLAFWTLIEPATSRMVRTTRVSEAPADEGEEESFSRSTKLVPIDEFFLFLNYLSTGWSQRELGQRFNIHQTTVSAIIVTWANFLYGLLGSVCTWMTAEQVKAHLPQEFMDYADTQVVIDCIELRCQTPSSQFLQSDNCSSQKFFCTFKAMVGMAPHGAVTFVSALYESSVSDKEIFRQSGIIPLLSSDVAVMVDKGFLVDDLVPGKVHRPASLYERDQTSAHDVPGTRFTSPVSAHVEKLFKRVQENKLFDTDIPLSISGSINQLFTAACLLSNYQNGPLAKKVKEEV